MKQLKKIELATYDVEEMNRQELMDTDGGLWDIVFDAVSYALTGQSFGYWKDQVGYYAGMGLSYTIYASGQQIYQSGPFFCPLR